MSDVLVTSQAAEQERIVAFSVRADKQPAGSAFGTDHPSDEPPSR